MMNLNIFKIIVLFFFVSCKNHYVDYRYEDKGEDINDITRNYQYLRVGKKTGTYIYPNLNFMFALEKGELNGKMVLVKQEDTLYYCFYDKNKPIGKYINNLYQARYTRYRTIMSMRPAITIDGEGTFNNNHKKEGFWKEFDGICSKKGSYVNGLKNGLWEEDCFNDSGPYENKKTVIYKNGSISNFIDN